MPVYSTMLFQKVAASLYWTAYGRRWPKRIRMFLLALTVSACGTVDVPSSPSTTPSSSTATGTGTAAQPTVQVNNTINNQTAGAPAAAPAATQPAEATGLSTSPAANSAIIVAEPADLPACYPASPGTLYYVTSTGEFTACKDGAWAPVPLGNEPPAPEDQSHA